MDCILAIDRASLYPLPQGETHSAELLVDPALLLGHVLEKLLVDQWLADVAEWAYWYIWCLTGDILKLTSFYCFTFFSMGFQL
jgi:hypothetical protein